MNCLFKVLSFLVITFSIHAYPAPYYVGDLGDHWAFPSDHLTIGATIDDYHIAFWNILCKDYLGHIEENTQGLRDASILRDNVLAPGYEPLTLREVAVTQAVLEMVSHKTHPRSLIALQETHHDVQKFLEENLPSSFIILTPPDQPSSHDIFIYDSERFDFISKDAVRYWEEKTKTIFTITLYDKILGKTFRFIQSHVPGGPNSPEGCAKFAAEVFRQFDPAMTTVLMGDMNKSPEVILEALEKGAKDAGALQPFHYLPVAYPTHMNTHKQASWIDLFFVYNPDGVSQSSDDPEELFSGLKAPIDYLHSMKPHPLGVSQEIANQLEQNGMAVIFGAPGSGKTEQMRIALEGKSTYVFDLRKEFLSHEEGFSKTDYNTSIAKKKQAEWFSSEQFSFPKADVMVFDEIDLSISENLNDDELSVLLEIVQIAKTMHASGSKVILIIHTSALQNKSFWEAMGSTDVVQTRYLREAEEDYLLDLTHLTLEQKTSYKSLSQGLPAAYLSLMDGKVFTSYDALIKDAEDHVMKNIGVIKTLNPMSFQTIKDLALGHISARDLDPKTVQELIYTGLVGMRNGELIFPTLVQDCTLNVRSFR